MFVAGKKIKALCYVIGGNTPILMGRPLLERLGLAVDYDKQVMKWPGQQWQSVPLGPKGEYLVHLAEDIKKFAEEEVYEEILLPEDAGDHVYLQERIELNELIDDIDLVNMAAHVECASSPASPTGTTDEGAGLESAAGLEPVHDGRDIEFPTDPQDSVSPADETSPRAADGTENRIGLEPYQSAKGMVSFDNTPDIVNVSVETYGKMPNLNTPTADEMVGLRDCHRVAQLTPPMMRKLILETKKTGKSKRER